MNTRRPRYHRHRFPPEIISHAVWLYHRYCMSFRDVEDLLAERGIIVSYETVRQWCGKFGPDYARQLKRRQGRLGDTWFLDEVFVTINGQRQYLWRAVDQDGDLIDILVQPRRDGRAARRFFRRLLKSQRQEPVRLVTDKLGSYRVAHRDLMPLVTRDTRRYANNRAEGIVKLRPQVAEYPMTSQPPSYRGYRFPSKIISHAVWLYYRFGLSFRDVEDLLAERGITVTYEAIRLWCRTFGLNYARRLRRRRGRQGDTWYLDELFVKIQGQQQYLWRAVDEDGDVLDILVQSRRNRRAATRFFRKLLKRQGREPRRLITDKLRSYSAAHRTVMPSVIHSTQQYENNRAEVSHQSTRQRERQMRRFRSAAHLQRFASVHGVVQNLFRVGRHLLRAAHHRLLRARSFRQWDEVTCAC